MLVALSILADCCCCLRQADSATRHAEQCSIALTSILAAQPRRRSDLAGQGCLPLWLHVCSELVLRACLRICLPFTVAFHLYSSMTLLQVERMARRRLSALPNSTTTADPTESTPRSNTTATWHPYTPQTQLVNLPRRLSPLSSFPSRPNGCRPSRPPPARRGRMDGRTTPQTPPAMPRYVDLQQY